MFRGLHAHREQHNLCSRISGKPLAMARGGRVRYNPWVIFIFAVQLKHREQVFSRRFVQPLAAFAEFMARTTFENQRT